MVRILEDGISRIVVLVKSTVQLLRCNSWLIAGVPVRYGHL